MPVTALLTLDDAKTHLNIAGSSDDAELQDTIDEATPIIEDIVGRVIEQTVTDEQHNNVTGGRIALLYRPVVSITTCTEYLGKVAYPVTVATDPTLTGTYAATLDGDKGVLTRWATGTPRDWYPTVYVTYVAGRDSLPDEVRRAAKILVAHLWQSQRGTASFRPSFGSEEDLVSTPSGFLVPNAVLEALRPQTRMDTFA